MSVFSQVELDADFDVIESTGCAPFVVNFIDISSGGDSWNWDFGNGVSSNKQNPTYVYSLPGIYTVSLTVSDSSGSDTEIKSSLIRVNPSPIVDFTVNDQTGCSPHRGKFTDLSIPTSATITDWFWAFGNGQTSGNQNPEVSFTEIKDYTVFLKITDGNGCTSSISKPDYIKLDGPEAIFLYDSVVCGLPANVTFLNQSTGNDLEYFWDFGDGTTSTGDVPGTHVYNSFDSTEVRLIITENKTGCSDTSTSSLVVGNYEAKFDWDIICENNGFTINVENTTSVYNSLVWDFNGESSAFTPDASHYFTGKGPYEIILKSTIDESCWDTTTIKYNLPKSKISYSAPFCSYPFEVSFDNQSLAKDFTSYWEFGDSTFSTEKNPVHIYDIPPEFFLAKLIIEDSFGCSDSTYKYVNVPFPIARFYEINSTYTGCPPLDLTFKDTSYTLSSNISSVQWDFGDPSSGINNFSSDTMPSHIYDKPGNYDIKYIIFTNDGCSDTSIYEAIIKVGEKPITASFDQLANDSVCYGESIQFIESATYSKNWIESNYFCWAFEENEDSLLLNSESPPVNCPNRTEYSNNSAYVNYSEPVHLYSKFNHDADTNLQAISTGEILPNAGDLFTHLIIGYNNCFTEVIRKTFVDTTIAVNGYVRNDSLELFSDSTIQIGLYQASLNYDSIAYSYVYSSSLTDTLIHIHKTDTTYHNFEEGNTYKIRTKIINSTSGCTNEITDIFPVDSSRLNFNLVNEKCLNQNPVLFADNSFSKFGNLKSRKWLVNDNIVATIKNINPVDSFYYSFPDTGIYKVTLELKYAVQYKKYGQWKTGYYTKNKSKEIRIEGVKAMGYSDTLQICSGEGIQFTDSSKSTTKIKEYKWLFGDDTVSSSSKNPYYEYTAAGSFTPSLLVTDTFGCSDSVPLSEIKVFKPKVQFKVSDSLICIGERVSIENYSEGNSLSFIWTIDSLIKFTSTINDQQFNTPGFFDVKLYAIDTFHCADSLIKTGRIEVSDIPDPQFTADILHKDCPPLSTFFSDTTNETIIKWLWDFGDGNTRTDKNPAHIFTTPGNYDISLTVTNYANCTDTITKSQYVKIGGPSGEVSLSSDTLCIPEAVAFNLSLSNTKYYIMNYGDENTISYDYQGNSDTIVHIYDQGGVYQPALELIDSLGCIHKLQELPKIYGDSMYTDFQTNSLIMCDLKNISFQNNSKSTFESICKWSFGNGDSSSEKSPIYSYTTDSTYEVSLNQTSQLGCMDSVKKTIKVVKAPYPSLSIQNENYCIPSKTSLKLTLENDAFNYDSIYFTIDESNILTGDSIVNTFWEKGEKTIEYTIEYAEKNCILDSIFTLSFYEWPLADFEYSPGNSSLEQPVIYFKDNSKNTTKWNWDFDDLESSSIQNPAHSYDIADEYNIRLIATNDGGCSDTIAKTITVSPYDFIKLPSAFSPNGDGKNETFSILSAGDIELIEFKIFNRWGNLVFKTNDIEEAWNGKRRGEDQNAGTYIYYVKWVKNSGETTEIKGNFTLLR